MGRRFRLFGLGSRPSPPSTSTYYVRPAGSTYGTGDGTSYANAWDGEANIDWTLLVDGTLLAFEFADGSITKLEPTTTIIYINGIGAMQVGETFTII